MATPGLLLPLVPPGLRLLPWSSPEGKPCFLSSDGQGVLAGLADDVEDAQMSSGMDVLTGARTVLRDARAGEHAVRFALTRTTEALRDALRVAHSRGERLAPHRRRREPR
ncbi:MAG: hypothetical protein ACRDP3_13820 [Streptomyces sp.]|uniref:hypothetical protein n=1 Tax=Streptomyces sp. TaxID=1931 RepID=UPI003D6BADFC